jgi:glutamine synthetase
MQPPAPPRRFDGTDAQQAEAWLKTEGVHSVRLEWPDMNGQARGRVVPADGFAAVCRGGVQFSSVALAFDLWTVPAPVPGLGGDVGYANVVALPDLATLRVLSHEPGVGHALVDVRGIDGAAVGAAPRALARRVAERLAAGGLTAQVAPEIEFYVTAADGQPLVAGEPCYGMFNRFQLRREIELLRAAAAPFVECEAWQHEHGPGQLEFNVPPLPLVAATDALYGVRTVLREAAAAAGFAATFMAKPFNGRNGSACQINVSLADAKGRNLFADAGDPLRISPLCRRFVAGVLEHLDALAAFVLPHGNSYRRIVPGHFAPVSKAWGIDNRTAALRVVNHTPAATRIEFRVAGADIAPHLALPALVAAGLDGIERELDPGPPAEGDLDRSTLPRIGGEWAQALRDLGASTWARDALGGPLVDTFLAIKRQELQREGRHVSDYDHTQIRPHV